MSGSPTPPPAQGDPYGTVWPSPATGTILHPGFSLPAPRPTQASASGPSDPLAGHLLRILSRDTKTSFPQGKADINSSERSTQGSEHFSLNFPLWLTNQLQNSKNNTVPTPVHQTTSLSSKGENYLCHFPPTGHKLIPSLADLRESCQRDERVVQTPEDRRGAAARNRSRAVARCLAGIHRAPRPLARLTGKPRETGPAEAELLRRTAGLLHRPSFSTQSTTSPLWSGKKSQPLSQITPVRSLPPPNLTAPHRGGQVPGPPFALPTLWSSSQDSREGKEEGGGSH